ncbi:MAG: FAD-dependent oxidoreductase [Burkholderiales bacterium]
MKILVVGAGVFGAWTAYHLRRAGHEVVLLEQYGPANSRASSGGESRIIRARYADDALLTGMALRSLALWKEFFARCERQQLFKRVGALWMARESDPRLAAHVRTLRSAGAEVQELGNAELRRRYPQIAIDAEVAAIFEPDAGALMARQAVQALVAQFVEDGGTYLQAKAQAPQGAGALSAIDTDQGRLQADAFVFACGPWLKTVLPGLLGQKIFPTRQAVFFYGAPPGDARFTAAQLPAWGDAFSDLPWYGLPDLESRGFKLAYGWLGEDFDPDRGDRQPTQDETERARQYLARRFPALADAPLLEMRVCQYENTSDSQFLIDRHPGFDNAWIAGGGSGHGFKHGPAVGEYVAARVLGAATPGVEARFSLESKGTSLPPRTAQRP